MIKQVGFQAPIKTSSGSSGKSGGSKLGQTLGAVAGGVIGAYAAPATGGASIAQGAMIGAGAGAGLGGMLGEAVSPSSPAREAMSRRLETAQPQLIQSENSQKLKQSLLALHSAPQAVRDEYGPQLVQAYLTSLTNDRRA